MRRFHKAVASRRSSLGTASTSASASTTYSSSKRRRKNSGSQNRKSGSGSPPPPFGFGGIAFADGFADAAATTTSSQANAVSSQLSNDGEPLSQFVTQATFRSPDVRRGQAAADPDDDVDESDTDDSTDAAADHAEGSSSNAAARSTKKTTAITSSQSSQPHHQTSPAAAAAAAAFSPFASAGAGNVDDDIGSSSSEEDVPATAPGSTAAKGYIGEDVATPMRTPAGAPRMMNAATLLSRMRRSGSNDSVPSSGQTPGPYDSATKKKLKNKVRGGLADQLERTLASLRSDATLRAHLRGTQSSSAAAASAASGGGGRRSAFSQPSSGSSSVVSASGGNHQQQQQQQEELLFGIISVEESCGLRVVRASLTHHPADFPARPPSSITDVFFPKHGVALVRGTVIRLFAPWQHAALPDNPNPVIIASSHAEVAAEEWSELPSSEPAYSCCAGIQAPSLCAMDAAGRFAPAFSYDGADDDDAAAVCSGGSGDPIRQRLLFAADGGAMADPAQQDSTALSQEQGEQGEQGEQRQQQQQQQQQQQPAGILFDELLPAQANVMLRGNVVGNVPSPSTAPPWKVLQDSNGSVVAVDVGGGSLDAFDGAVGAAAVFVTGARVVRRLAQAEQSRVLSMLETAEVDFTPTPVLLLLALEGGATVTAAA